jgi:asparagine synthetase B (glutamine-hydrolysing)
LTGLLQRLDTATMLAGVEGRTPFADARVAKLAEALPLGLKFVSGEGGEAAGTKVVLREAFGDVVPARVNARAKASFPLPFGGWMGPMAGGLRDSSFARAVFGAGAIDFVAADPERNWRLAWPMLNVAMWGDSVWG